MRNPSSDGAQDRVNAMKPSWTRNQETRVRSPAAATRAFCRRCSVRALEESSVRPPARLPRQSEVRPQQQKMYEGSSPIRTNTPKPTAALRWAKPKYSRADSSSASRSASKVAEALAGPPQRQGMFIAPYESHVEERNCASVSPVQRSLAMSFCANGGS